MSTSAACCFSLEKDSVELEDFLGTAAAGSGYERSISGTVPSIVNDV